MRHLLDLCKRRGFLFQSAEIHGGLRGAYDYGPLGVELKRNLSQEWWNSMVYQRSDVVGIDTAIITPPAVLKASGHVDQFTDEMVDSFLSKERFRPDKAPELRLDDQGKILPITAPDKVAAKLWEQEIRNRFAKGALISRSGKEIQLQVERMEKDRIILKQDPTSSSSSSGDDTSLRIPYRGYVDPNSNSPFLTDPRPFNLMFKTYLDPIDPIDKVITTTVEAQKSLDLVATRQQVDKTLYPSLTYLRPETAQGVFINYMTVQRSHPHLKMPFGIAQIGKSFRNEIRLEHAIFRTPEFEQMELEYFVAPWQAQQEFSIWRKLRMDWWKTYARHHDRIRERPHAPDELAHYSRGCVDVEYLFPWGWGEVEGIANRGDFDLTQHMEATGIKLQYTDQILMQERTLREKTTGEKETSAEVLARERYTPHVIESSCGLNRTMLALMLDAMEIVDEQGQTVSLENDKDEANIKSRQDLRTVMKLHPRLAPVKVAVMPLISNNNNLVDICSDISQALRQELQVNVALETQSTTIGRRYYRMDEIGTPWCVTADFESLTDNMVTIRDRDTAEQRRVTKEEVIEIV
ncbi:glycyl-tRNA synthetase, partial [Mortierella sp. GBAus27b]